MFNCLIELIRLRSLFFIDLSAVPLPLSVAKARSLPRSTQQSHYDAGLAPSQPILQIMFMFDPNE